MPAKQRALLARFILSTLDDVGDDQEDLDALWYAEADCRRQAYLKGNMKSMPMEDAFAKARQELI